MHKKYTALGLMSGTSADGVDASVIISNGIDHYESIKDKFFEYDDGIYKKIHKLREKISNLNDLNKYKDELLILEREITLFHAKVVKDFDQLPNDFLVGFHGQTIYHNINHKISKQLGDAKLLHQLSKKKIIYNFREKDILNGGQGAPLASIFHQIIVKKYRIELPVCFLNIGGIANITLINDYDKFDNLISKDIGPGNCLIDTWIRKNSKINFDKNGKLASTGEVNQIIFEQGQELFENRLNKKKLSYDVSDFDVSFVRGLSLEDGAATLTEFTSSILASELNLNLSKLSHPIKNILLCGGGRKNKVLIKKIREKIGIKIKIKSIDEYNISGDFIESQAFGFLAIRSIINLPISFPKTTGCKKPSAGGELIDY